MPHYIAIAPGTQLLTHVRAIDELATVVEVTAAEVAVAVEGKREPVVTSLHELLAHLGPEAECPICQWETLNSI